MEETDPTILFGRFPQLIMIKRWGSGMGKHSLHVRKGRITAEEHSNADEVGWEGF